MRQDRKNLFLNLILYEKSRDLRAIEEAAKSVDYSQALFRAPVVFVPENGADAVDLLQSIKMWADHSNTPSIFERPRTPHPGSLMLDSHQLRRSSWAACFLAAAARHSLYV